MNEIIQAHNFEEAIRKIECFSNSIPEDLRLRKFEEKCGLFNLFDHNVTGEEMNDFIRDLQSLLIKSNENTRSLYAEFKEVYNAFDALDKEYIQAILLSIDASTNASSRALEAQEEIAKTIEALQLTVSSLKNFKGSVSEQLQALKSDTNILFENVGFLSESLNTTSDELSRVTLLLDEKEREIQKKVLIISQLEESIKEFQQRQARKQLYFNLMAGGALFISIVLLLLNLLNLI